MKTLKKIITISIVFLFMNTYSYCAKFDVFYNITSSVTCNIGDTLVFYSAGAGMHGVWINDFTTLVYGGYVESGSNVFLANYTVQANDTNFTITHQPTATHWTGTIHVNTITDIENLYQGFKFNIFPNPVCTELNVLYYKKIEKVIIKSIRGEIINVFKGNNDSFLSINIANLPEGIYFLEVGNNIRKFIKTK